MATFITDSRPSQCTVRSLLEMALKMKFAEKCPDPIG